MNAEPLLGTPMTLNDPDVGDPGNSGLDLNLRALWAAVYRNRLIVAVCVAICLLGSFLYILLATPSYAAQASVQIEQETTKVFKGEDRDGARDALESTRFLQTQVDIIKSSSLAMEVGRSLHLVGNVDFLERMKLKPILATSANVTPSVAQQQQVAAILDRFLKVDLPIDSRIVTIEFRSPDPVLSAQVANGFADSYIRTDLARRYGTSAYARQFISQQLQDAKQQLERSERASLDYASQQRLIDTSNGADPTQSGASAGPKSLTVARLVALNAAYADVQAKRIQAEQKWQQAQGASIMSLPEVLANPAMQALVQRRAQASSDYQDQRQTRKEDFPSVRQVKAQIDETTRQIATLAGQIRLSLRAQFETAIRQEASFKQQIGGLEQATLAEQQREVQLSILRRATDTSRSLYDTLLGRFRELSAQAGVQPNNIQIIDRAEVPGKPVSPKPLLAIALGLVAGLLASAAAIFIVENLNETVRTGEDVARKINVPLLGAVPKVKATDVEGGLRDLKSSISEAYGSVRVALLMSARGGLPRTLAVTSAQASEGKTTSLFATAIGLGRIGKRVIAIDCDMRRPALHAIVGVRNDRGISNYLSGQASSSDILHKTPYDGVSVITTGPIPPNPAELLTGDLFAVLLKELGEIADIVIIDSPPILGLADAVIIGANVEATILVLQAGRNYHGGLRSAVARLRKGGAKIIGAVITKQDMRDIGYNYNYNYYKYDSAT